MKHSIKLKFHFIKKKIISNSMYKKPTHTDLGLWYVCSNYKFNLISCFNQSCAQIFFQLSSIYRRINWNIYASFLQEPISS